MEASYQKKLELPDCPEQRLLPAQLCLCTVTDMGEIGSFRSADVRCLLEKIRAEYPVAEGSVYGRLLMRGWDDRAFHRFLELEIPLRKA